MHRGLLSCCICVFILAISLACWPCAVFGLTTATIAPLAGGDSWTYQVVENGVSSSETRTVSPNKVLFAGTSVFEIIYSNGQKYYLLNDSAGYREFGAYFPDVFVSGYGTTRVTVTMSPAVVMAPATFDVGETHSGSSTVTYLYQGVGSLSGPITFSTTAVGFEYVSVPAGTFYALKVETASSLTVTSSTNGQSISLTSTQTDWLAENVGTVKSTYGDSKGVTKSRELVGYLLPPPTTTTITIATTTTTTGSSTTTTTLPAGQLQGVIPFGGGWNLVGNSSSTPLDVSATFGDSSLVTTVWKWITSSSKWAFYAPSLSGQALTDYAASKGYDVLTTIEGGEGFWVNANQSFLKPLPIGTSVTSMSFQDGKPGALTQGWHLISIGNTKTPGGFNSDIGAVPPTAGVIPENVLTLWAWSNSQSKWYFYAPSLEAKGGTALSDYIISKGYLDFTESDKTLGSGVGFWVNKP